MSVFRSVYSLLSFILRFSWIFWVRCLIYHNDYFLLFFWWDFWTTMKVYFVLALLSPDRSSSVEIAGIVSVVWIKFHLFVHQAGPVLVRSSAWADTCKHHEVFCWNVNVFVRSSVDAHRSIETRTQGVAVPAARCISISRVVCDVIQRTHHVMRKVYLTSFVFLV